MRVNGVDKDTPVIIYYVTSFIDRISSTSYLLQIINSLSYYLTKLQERNNEWSKGYSSNQRISKRKWPFYPFYYGFNVWTNSLFYSIVYTVELYNEAHTNRDLSKLILIIILLVFLLVIIVSKPELCGVKKTDILI